MSPFKVEHMMFLKLNQGCVQKYNAVIAAQHKIRSQCLQDVQSAKEAAAGEMVVEIIEELVRSGGYMPKVEGMGDAAVREKKC